MKHTFTDEKGDLGVVGDSAVGDLLDGGVDGVAEGGD
jgi:hypothetical protein